MGRPPQPPPRPRLHLFPDARDSGAVPAADGQARQLHEQRRLPSEGRHWAPWVVPLASGQVRASFGRRRPPTAALNWHQCCPCRCQANVFFCQCLCCISNAAPAAVVCQRPVAGHGARSQWTQVYSHGFWSRQRLPMLQTIWYVHTSIFRTMRGCLSCAFTKRSCAS